MQSFLSTIDEPVLDEKRGLSVHLQPPGKKPNAWLKVIQTVPSHLPKAWILCLQLSLLPHSLSTSVKLLSLSLCNSLSLYRAPAAQLHGSRASDPRSRTPSFKLSSSLVSARTSHRHSSSPSHPRRDATVDRMPRCGEPAVKGKGAREWERERREKGGESSWKRMTSPVQRARERESEGARGWEVVWMKQEQVGGNCIRWIGCWADVDERETEIEREEREHLYWSAGNIKLSILRASPSPLWA